MTFPDGHSPVSMRERLRLTNGKSKVSSALGLGTELEAAGATVELLPISLEDVRLELDSKRHDAEPPPCFYLGMSAERNRKRGS